MLVFYNMSSLHGAIICITNILNNSKWKFILMVWRKQLGTISEVSYTLNNRSKNQIDRETKDKKDKWTHAEQNTTENRTEQNRIDEMKLYKVSQSVRTSDIRACRETTKDQDQEQLRHNLHIQLHMQCTHTRICLVVETITPKIEIRVVLDNTWNGITVLNEGTLGPEKRNWNFKFKSSVSAFKFKNCI